jgi:hypothetical protein
MPIRYAKTGILRHLQYFAVGAIVPIVCSIGCWLFIRGLYFLDHHPQIATNVFAGVFICIGIYLTYLMGKHILEGGE